MSTFIILCLLLVLVGGTMKYILLDTKDITPEQLQKVIETVAEFSKGEKPEVYELNVDLVKFGKTEDLQKAVQEQENAAVQEPVEQKQPEPKPVAKKRKIGTTVSHSGVSSSNTLVKWLAGCQNSNEVQQLHVGSNMETANGMLALVVYNYSGDGYAHVAAAFRDENLVRVCKIHIGHLRRLVDQQILAINSKEKTGGANMSLVLREVIYAIANNYEGLEAYPKALSIRTWRRIKKIMNWS